MCDRYAPVWKDYTISNPCGKNAHALDVLQHDMDYSTTSYLPRKNACTLGVIQNERDYSTLYALRKILVHYV